MKNSKKIISMFMVALSFLAILWFVSSKSYSTPLINNSVSKFSADNAYEHVKYLAQKIGPRPAGSKSELKAAQYIDYVLRQNGWKVKEQPFSKIVAGL